MHANAPISGSSPALLVLCSEHGAATPLVMASYDTVVLQSFGGSMPAVSDINHPDLVTVEYALGVVGARHVIVTGHSACGALGLDMGRQKLRGEARSLAVRRSRAR